MKTLNRLLVQAAGAVVAVAAIATLNRTSAAFEVAEGVALLYPASAAMVVAAVLLGWWGVLASFLALLVTPWGLSTTPLRLVYFSAAASLQAAIPRAVGLRADGSTTRRTLRVLVVAAILNTLLSAVLALPGIVAFSVNPVTSRELLLSFSSWFLGDMTAIVLLALPIVVAIRPELMLCDTGYQQLRRWSREWRLHAVSLAVLGATAAAMELLASRVDLHWLAVPLIAAILANAIRGGVGAALIANGVAGAVYLVQVVRLIAPGDHLPMAQEVFSSYLNLLLFTIVALAAGLSSVRSKALVVELDEHRRLLQESFERVVTALAAAIEAKDPTTEGHVQRVARFAVAVGRRLGIEGQRLELLRYAALLHDVGKLGVPEVILNKTGELEPGERLVLERHVVVGVEILENVDILAPAIPFIRYHQERWDGLRLEDGVRFPGYFGLAGEEIPLESRIIAVVDAWDAMTSDRPYRRALLPHQAKAEITQGAGQQFDPSVVRALLELLDDDRLLEPERRVPMLAGEAPRWIRD